ncbi:Excitatory amino acid transporter 3 [Liparis tanakae]|uniref:Amino acid transporter n=1 Tax=Liparis tanakae TaxID=230148 RepID=A0A4Z2J219_9TELE|nr:Excitatory amino acid transporter 3 [Liparis tanakae]
MSSFSAAGVPATGAVTTIFVLTAVGLPTKDASIFFAVEWILDRLNTVVNVLSDCICVDIIHGLSKKDLEDIERGDSGEHHHQQPISVSEGLAVCQRLGVLQRVRLNVSHADDALYALKTDW